MTDRTANADQQAAWEGEAEHWATRSARYDRSVGAHHGVLLDAAGVGAAERVLDVGCGTGQCARNAARSAPDGSALGVDITPRLIERARQLADDEGVANVAFLTADAQVHPLGDGGHDGGHDVVLSRFGAMFFGDPVAAWANLARAVRPGGRLALVAWQELDRNEWQLALRSALAVGRTLPTPPPHRPGPFGLADPTFVRRVLGEAGWADVELADVQVPIWFGTDADDALGFLREMGAVRGLLHDLADAERARGLDQLRTTLQQATGPDGVTFASAAWLITATRP